MPKARNRPAERADRSRPPLQRLPKATGADSELANFVEGIDIVGGTCAVASQALIQEFDGLPRVRSHPVSSDCNSSVLAASEALAGWPGGVQGVIEQISSAGYATNPQDWARRFLPANGGCAYIDLDHLELCIPEVLSAHDHVAAWHAMLRIARRALDRANARRPRDRKIHVLVNNSDGFGHSYGSHINFLVTRRAWSNIFDRRMHYLLFLAAYQVSSIIFTGQGKVGSENGAPPVSYQLSQRADFFERLTGTQTTFLRPLVNSRDEPLCGTLGRGAGSSDPEPGAPARLHVIFFDNTLSHVTTLLKVGVMQIILAMIEAEQINASLILDDPLDAVIRWSHDPSLEAKARLSSGRRLTAVELQLRFLEESSRFVARGGCAGLVPRAEEILALWGDTLEKLGARDLPALSRRLDWALKLTIIERVMEERRDLGWDDPEIKHLDHAYSHLDPGRGLYWSCERGGLVEQVVGEAAIERFTREPPPETRAWTRAMLLRRAGPGRVDHVDWDSIRFRIHRGESGSWPEAIGRRSGGIVGWPAERQTFDMADPLAYTRAEAEAVIAGCETAPLSDVLDLLAATPGALDTESSPDLSPMHGNGDRSLTEGDDDVHS